MCLKQIVASLAVELEEKENNVICGNQLDRVDRTKCA
jgi:hypothetical protein